MYHRNYRNRSSIKSEFSPSLRKASTPNYYQRKGRTIQQSPLNLRNVPTEMMSRKKLDKLYRTLVQYKYQFPTRPLPSNINIQPFLIKIPQQTAEMFSGNNSKFGTLQLYQLSLSTLRTNYPEIVDLYQWEFQLLSIQFYRILNTGPFDENKQYFINWNSNLLQAGNYQIFIKSVDIAYNDYFSAAPIEERPSGINQDTGNVIVRGEALAVSAGGTAVTRTNNLQSNDNNIIDNGQYPFIDTNALPDDLYYGELEFVRSSGMQEDEYSDGLRLRLYVLCIPRIES